MCVARCANFDKLYIIIIIIIIAAAAAKNAVVVVLLVLFAPCLSAGIKM